MGLGARFENLNEEFIIIDPLKVIRFGAALTNILFDVVLTLTTQNILAMITFKHIEWNFLTFRTGGHFLQKLNGDPMALVGLKVFRFVVN